VLELDGGGSCGADTLPNEGYTPPSGLRITRPSGLEIRRGSCPVFGPEADTLQPSMKRERRLRGPHLMPVSVRAGPFTITDEAGYFELQSPKGRRAAARWVRQTLAAVRQCWDIADDSSHLVARLYADLAVLNGRFGSKLTVGVMPKSGRRT
jgi:hypothetical protein